MTETATTAVTPLAPVAMGSRVDSLDLIRGFAVLGILAVNAMIFFWPHTVSSNASLQSGWDAEAAAGWQIMNVFFMDKMRTLFAMLFGVSIFLVGGDRSDAARGKLLRSRLFWLALFGVIHGALFWAGDILLLYACSGFLVLLARSWSARRLLIVGGVACLLLSLTFVGMMSAMAFAPPEVIAQSIAQQGWNMTPAEMAVAVARFQQDALTVTSNQFQLWLFVGPFIVATFIPMTASLMLIGMGLFKSGFLAGRSPTWLYGLFVALAAVILLLIWGESTAIREGGFQYVQASTRPLASILVPLVSIGYASALILLLKVGLRTLLYPLIAAGRMAFTNYLTQTLIMTTISYGGRGLGYYGEIGWPEMWMLIGAIWVVQLIWSPLWLHYFRMGPFEWVWRRLSYGRTLPIRRDAAPA